MSQLLCRLSKLSRRNHSLTRLFSSSSETTPYLTLAFSEVTRGPGGVDFGTVTLHDAAKEEILRVRNKKVPNEIIGTHGIGCSRGWMLFFHPQERSVFISDLFNPKSVSTLIPLPKLTTMGFDSQAGLNWNVAMSSPDEDWAIAIKFLGRQLSICRPFNPDLPWTNILTPFGYSENSNLMFSKRDQRFYLTSPGGHHLFSYGLNFTEDENPKTHELQFRNVPELSHSEWEMLDSCCKIEYFVESTSTDERFLIKWYGEVDIKYNQGYITKKFMVFREEETLEGRYMCYTEDIGDICIFLSGSEPFCLEASSCPGLKPNTIYHARHGLGTYNLATKTFIPLQHREGAPVSITAPYWLPPYST